MLFSDDKAEVDQLFLNTTLLFLYETRLYVLRSRPGMNYIDNKWTMRYNQLRKKDRIMPTYVCSCE